MGSVSLHAAADILHKYQGVASSRVISAVQNASAKTGVDFAFLMEKASAESGFNASAKASHSSARGLYQFISDTWLHMVKSHGDEFGLGNYADKIEIKNGKACVGDCKVRDEILNLRNDPEISALMAGAFSADNKSYLAAHTGGKVGSAELSIAHFLGAGGAANFLNARAHNGDAVAANAFPHEARVNKGVFYDASGHPRTFNQIYKFFSHKFTGGTAGAAAAPTSTPVAAAAPSVPARASATPARSGNPNAFLNTFGTQALSTFNDGAHTPHIIWDHPRSRHDTASGFGHHKSPGSQKLDAATVLTMAEMAHAPAAASHLDAYGYNS